MNGDKFEDEIKRLRRRLELLRLARSGNVDVRKIRVKEHWVRRHKVRTHTRVLYSKRGDK